MIRVLVLRKIFSTKPQQFMLVLKDPIKVQNTEFGAEAEVRTKLSSESTSGELNWRRSSWEKMPRGPARTRRPTVRKSTS